MASVLKTIHPETLASNLTKREFFAASIIIGLIAREGGEDDLYQPPIEKDEMTTSRHIAKHAVVMADQLIAELAKK